MVRCLWDIGVVIIGNVCGVVGLILFVGWILLN